MMHQQTWTTPACAPRPLVMVAEDDPDLRDLLCSQLSRANYDVLVAKDGASAMAHIDRAIRDLSDYRFPDLVITDFRMPNNDGLDLLAYAGFIPSILITGFPSPQLRDAAHRIGADYVFEKPFDMRELATAIDTLLS